MKLPSWRWWRTVLVFVPLVSLCTIAFGVLSLVSGVGDAQGRRAHRCAQWWARCVLWATRVRVQVEGAFPVLHGSVVYVCNHQSIYDIPVVFAAIPGQLRILAKAMLGRIPFIGWHLRRAGHVLVDRVHPGPSVWRKMRRLVRSGASLVVFPEGTRSSDGQVGRFKAGVFAMAIAHQLPIVPLTVIGTGAIMRKGEVTVHPGSVRVIVHPPTSTVGLTRDDVARLAARVRAIVARTQHPEPSTPNPERHQEP